jgi:hypothetical protein
VTRPSEILHNSYFPLTGSPTWKFHTPLHSTTQPPSMTQIFKQKHIG